MMMMSEKYITSNERWMVIAGHPKGVLVQQKILFFEQVTPLCCQNGAPFGWWPVLWLFTDENMKVGIIIIIRFVLCALLYGLGVGGYLV